MKNKRPETIADLDINWKIDEYFWSKDKFLTKFKEANPNLFNYKIVPDNYVFTFDSIVEYHFSTIREEYYLFDLFDLLSKWVRYYGLCDYRITSIIKITDSEYKINLKLL